MKVVGKKGGEKSTTVKDNIVTCVHVTLHKASEKNYQLTTTFDFAEVAQDTLLRLAAETLLIRWRTSFKSADTVDDSADNQIVSVKQMLRGSKPRMSKKDMASKALADMSEEEKRAFILEHAAALGIDVQLSGEE